MKNFISTAMDNPIISCIISLITYIFYGIVLGISLIPSVLFIYFVYNFIGVFDIYHLILFALSIGVSIYIFFITSLIVFGIFERILTIGFKPGRYSTSSFLFARWLIYSGLHCILLRLVLPYVSGTIWAKIFYRILGCKIGKNVFINTNGLHDAYLLEIEDNVVIGGDANITCHIFEGNHLILGRIKIGSNTLISAETYIMPGVTIGQNCNIGVKSYIRKNKSIPDKSLIMSIPGMPSKKVASIIRNTDKEEIMN